MRILPAFVEFPVHPCPRRRAALTAPVLPPAADASSATYLPVRTSRGRPPATRNRPAAGPATVLRPTAVGAPARPGPSSFHD
ncbi:hypothetical protein P376_1563 [Streptomyces sp. HCCB10043]|nr:hypothetical protein P376_1563 [Streptomyces sp. HCCB10043]